MCSKHLFFTYVQQYNQVCARWKKLFLLLQYLNTLLEGLDFQVASLIGGL